MYGIITEQKTNFCEHRFRESVIPLYHETIKKMNCENEYLYVRNKEDATLEITDNEGAELIIQN